MGRYFKKLIASVITISVLFSFAGFVNATNQSEVEGFVNRCYSGILGREADAAGREYWTGSLVSGYYSGIDIVNQFLFSHEYKSRNRTDAEFVSDLYWTFMDRAPDAFGLAYWQNEIASGKNDQQIINAFATSAEFVSVCQGYGINPGSPKAGEGYCRYYKGAEQFVARMYVVILGRAANASEISYWTSALMNGSITGIGLANSFVFSNEYKDMNKSDANYIKDLYRALMGREADQAGITYWTNNISNMVDDKTIFNGIATSAEFRAICADYGITVGSPIGGAECARRHSEIVTVTINGHTVSGYFDYEAELEIYLQLNAYRASEGLNTLSRPGDLHRISMLRAEETVASFAHTRPNGTSCFTTYANTSYGYKGENIAAGQPSATAAMNGWRNSTSHNANMLKDTYTSVGIAVFVVTSDSYQEKPFGTYYVQNFGG